MNAIITGGTKGIGRAIATLLLGKGVDVCICSRTQSDIDDFIDVSKKEYPEVTAHGYRADLSNKEEVSTFADYILKTCKSVDVLINNAGVFLPGEIINEPPGRLEKTINTNLYSAYHLTRALAPTMIKQGSGHIFNMCSVASIKAYPNGGSYSISKFALLGFSKALREEMKSKNIKVTSILPGATWSASWDGIDLPKNRLMKAEDIAKIVWTAIQMSPSSVIEDIVIRPQLGDL